MAELCLGTVQFGMKYGIGNRDGQPSEESCFAMLDTALNNGIHKIDTARAYGTAEIVVGNYLKYRKCHHNVDIISKLRPNILEPEVKDVYSVIRKELEESLKRLDISQLKGYLLHTPEYVYQEKIVEALFRLKDEKLVQNIGVSIYGMEEGYEAIRQGMDYVQLPYSVLDQRGKQSGFIQKAKKAGMTVFTRSAFLQGLFLMERSQIPICLEHAKPYLAQFDFLTEQYSMDKLALLLAFVRQTQGIDYLVFGVDTKEQLTENIRKFTQHDSIDKTLLREIQEYFGQVDESIILPSLWSNGKKTE